MTWLIWCERTAKALERLRSLRCSPKWKVPFSHELAYLNLFTLTGFTTETTYNTTSQPDETTATHSTYVTAITTVEEFHCSTYTCIALSSHVEMRQITNSQFEPRHDKTNKMNVHPVKTQISLGIHPVWSASSLCAQWVANDPRFLHADSGDSDQTRHMPFCWFCHEVAHLIFSTQLQMNEKVLCWKQIFVFWPEVLKSWVLFLLLLWL